MLGTSYTAAAVSCLALVSLTFTAHADVPPYMPIQGRLANDAGEALEGEHEVRFRLYSTQEPVDSSSVLHDETQTLTLRGGLFTAYLGDQELLSPALFLNQPLVFLGVQVGEDEEMRPLLQLATAPFASFAQHCSDAATVAGVQPTELQRRISGACGMNQFVRAFNEDGTMACAPLPATQAVTGVTAGTGLSGGGASGDIALSVDSAYVQRRVSGTCESTAIRSITASGAVVCSPLPQSITSVNAGFALAGGGSSSTVTLDVEPSAFHVEPVHARQGTSNQVTGTGWTTVYSRSIRPPASTAGSILAVYSAAVAASSSTHVLGYVGLTTGASLAPDEETYVAPGGSAPWQNVTVHKIFPVSPSASPPLTTVYARARMDVSGSHAYMSSTMTLIFLPH